MAKVLIDFSTITQSLNFKFYFTKTALLNLLSILFNQDIIKRCLQHIDKQQSLYIVNLHLKFTL